MGLVLTFFEKIPAQNGYGRVNNNHGNPIILLIMVQTIFRAGIFYVGFGLLKLGINSEEIRYNTQNWLHINVTNDPTFKKLPRKPRFFWELF